ncbi:MAG: hypothetical protein OXU51_11630 [Candidatus Poribacteria bacterium]|nr:hypothetical protein [Candidatus Poribacteria bacterium]
MKSVFMALWCFLIGEISIDGVIRNTLEIGKENYPIPEGEKCDAGKLFMLFFCSFKKTER